jgi:hypothetical protein
MSGRASELTAALVARVCDSAPAVRGVPAPDPDFGLWSAGP